MLNINQIIKIKWNNANKKHYMSLGYEFTKINDTFDVSVKDLPIGTHKKVKIICDYCNNEFEKQYCDYVKCHDITPKDACPNCGRLKREETCEKLYGVKYALQSNKFIEKMANTNMERHGKPWTTQTDNMKYKSAQTCIEKYGVDNVFKSEAFQNKGKQTCLERYGVKNVFELEEVQNKIRQTYYTKGGIKTSKMESMLCELLYDIYGKENCFPSYPLSRINMDCMLSIFDKKIDIEYDGWYWHKDKQDYDRKRDEFVKSQGFKVLRIKGNREIPTKEQIESSINYLINNDCNYTEIILDI